MDTRLNTLFLGKVLLEYERLDSTNSQAERLLMESKPAEGTVVFTYNQFSGRGQMGNEWFNDVYKNLTTSIILYPKIDFPKKQFALNQIVALGLKHCISTYCGHHVSIKWPNDIIVNDKKIAGVLIQNSISKNTISHSIIGIGININQEVFPKGIGEPTSIFKEINQRFDVKDVLFDLCNAIEAWYLRLKAGQFDLIDEAYHASLYLKGEKRWFRTSDGERLEGEIIGVSREGQLRIKTLGEERLFMFKEISLL